MTAWRAHRYGAFESVLEQERCDVPQLDARSAIIRVAAVGLNFLDILSIAGKYQETSPLPFIPGVEAAGCVVAVAPGAPFRIGDKVMTVGKAACAEFMPAAPPTTFVLPEKMTFADAAAMQLTYQTAHMALVHRGRLKAGEFLLVNAAAGGVGTAAVQVGRSLGARVIAAAGSPEKLEVCRRCGAEAVIDYTRADVVETVKAITQGRGVDVVFDPVGGSMFEAGTKCVAFEGRIVVIGFASGQIPSIAVNRILLKNIDVIGLFWGNYSRFDSDRISRTQSDLYRLWRAGMIEPVVYRHFDFDDLPEALAALASRRSYGKVIVKGPVTEDDPMAE